MFFRKKKYQQEQTYKEAYHAFFGVCMRYCTKKEEAIEVFNDAMLNFFEYEKKNKVKEQGKYSLIKKIIINKCIDFSRKKKMLFDDIDESAPLFGTIQNEGELNMIREELLQKVQNFPTQTRVIFNLYVFEGWSHKEIAAHLNISVNTTSWHVNQGKKQIISLLKKPNLT